MDPADANAETESRIQSSEISSTGAALFFVIHPELFGRERPHFFTSPRPRENEGDGAAVAGIRAIEEPAKTSELALLNSAVAAHIPFIPMGCEPSKTHWAGWHSQGAVQWNALEAWQNYLDSSPKRVILKVIPSYCSDSADWAKATRLRVLL